MASNKFRVLLLGSTIAVVAASTAAFAQTAPAAPAPDDGLEIIVVTAQKRSSVLQDTPVAISAFSGKTLEERGIDDIANLQSYVPNLHIGAEQDGVKISLRGIGLQGTTSISDSGVAFYVDNFYIGRPAGGSAVFYDIDRIEVLRGPQGTLYGRNATGGVVNVISKLPNVNEFQGALGASAGSRDLVEGRGMINIPLPQNAAFRLSAVYTQEDGYVKNVSTEPGTKNGFGTDGDLTTRAQLLVGTPSDLEVLVSANYSRLKGTGVTLNFLERRLGGAPPVQAFARTLLPDNPNPLITNNNAPAQNVIETTSGFVRLTKEFAGVEGVLQVGKMFQTSDLLQDFDGSALDIGRFRKFQESEAESVEARLASTGAGPLTWLAGAYYFNEKAYILRVVNLRGLTPGGIINLPPFILDETGRSRTLAAFGSATYSFSENFRVTAGIRYTDDLKVGTKVTRGNFGQPFPPDIPNAAFAGIGKFNKVTWKIGTEWDLSDDVFVYANLSTGYKAGGFNISSDASPYKPEEITAFEFGVKSDFLNRRARLNLDTFYYDYTDMQLTTLGTFGPSNAPGQFTVNAGQSRIFGAELEGQYKLTPKFVINASYAYTNAEFTELFNADPRGGGRLDLSGNEVPYVSPHTINLGAEYKTRLGSAGDLTAAINYNWHSRMYLREFNNPIIDLVPENSKTDITITYRPASSKLKLTAYVTNLEDEIEKNNIYVSPGFIGTSAVASYSKPRSIGVRADFEF